MSKKNRGFTLIELLIVTVVIVTLMSITLRLAGAGGDTQKKSKTIARLQRLENAISGYYAAYGSYPPVPLQGRSQDINLKADANGLQGDAHEPRLNAKPANVKDEDKRQVEVACRAQPVAVLFPFFMSDTDSDRRGKAEDLVRLIKSEKKGDFNPLRKGNVGSLNLRESSWQEVQLFQFGLLSFLLPRYLFMLGGDAAMYDGKDGKGRSGQWAANNQIPCRIDSGVPYESWEHMQKCLYKRGGSGNSWDAWAVSNLTSQAVCARWMPNLEGIISGGLEFYGIDTSDDEWPYLNGHMYEGIPGYHKFLRQFSPDGFESKSSLYLLNGMTVADGWGNEFYYHSQPPYQSYDLWSGGANYMTFPPWLDESEFSSAELKTIRQWKGDDVRHLSN